MMHKLRELLRLVVPEHLVMPFVSVFAGALIALREIPPPMITLDTIFIFCLLVLGFNASNPLFDIKADKINKPNKATVTKAIDKKTVIGSAAVFYFLGNLLAFIIQPALIGVTLLFTLLSIAYSMPPLRLKARFLLTNFTGGVLHGFLPLVAAPVVFNTAVPWGLFLFFMLMTTILTSCKDFEDYKGDKKYRIKTIPVVFGIRKGARIISAALLLLFGMMYVLIYARIIDRALIYPTIISTVFTVTLVIKLLRETRKYKVQKNVLYQGTLARWAMATGLLIELTYGFSFIKRFV